MANEFVIKRGLIVSGSSELSGSLTVTGLAGASGQILEIGTGGILQTSGNTLNQNLGTSATPSFAGITVNGNATVTGNLDVQGTVTSINSNDLFIKDKLVVIASGSTSTSDADGAGLFISGAEASITWDNGNSRMEINKALDVAGALTATSLAGTGGSITGLNASNISSGTINDARLPGTITSDITGNAATATTATQVGNALTAGSGLSAAGTFTGAAARTFTVNSGSMATFFRQNAYSNTSGDITINSSGVAAISSGVIVNADIASGAAIATSKLAANTISGKTLGSNLSSLTISTGLSGTSYNGSSAITIAIDSTVVTLAGAQTLTNKTLTSPVINTPNFGSNNIVSTGASSNLSGSFSGSFFGDGSGLSGVSATFPLTITTVTPTLKYFVNDGAASRYIDQDDLGGYMAGDGLTNVNGILEVDSGSLVAYYTGSTFNKITGDIAITAGGVASISSGVIVNGDIASGAAIAVSKLAASTISGITLGNNLNALTAGSGLSAAGTYNGGTARTFGVDSGSMATYFRQNAYSNISGDITVNSSGVAAIGSGVIVNGDIANTTISNAKLVNDDITIGSTSIALGNSATTITGLTSVTSTGFTGALTGNASTATTLQTARTINGVSFNGSANITITANTTNALTVSTGLQLNSGTTFNGSAARTISIDSSVVTLTGTQTLTNKTLDTPDIDNPIITTPTLTDTITLKTTGITSTDSRILRGETSTTVGTQTVLTSGTSAGEAVFFDYVIAKSTTDMRAGTVMAVANGSTLRFAEQATTDIGNTSTVILQCVQSGGNITLQAVDTVGGFTVRALARTI